MVSHWDSLREQGAIIKALCQQLNAMPTQTIIGELDTMESSKLLSIQAEIHLASYRVRRLASEIIAWRSAYTGRHHTRQNSFKTTNSWASFAGFADSSAPCHALNLELTSTHGHEADDDLGDWYCDAIMRGVSDDRPAVFFHKRHGNGYDSALRTAYGVSDGWIDQEMNAMDNVARFA